MSTDSQAGAERRNLIVADIVERTGIDSVMIERLVGAFYQRAPVAIHSSVRSSSAK